MFTAHPSPFPYGNPAPSLPAGDSVAPTTPCDAPISCAAIGAEEARSAIRVQVRARIAKLSRREHDVFACVVAGHTNRATAAELGLSEKTVEEYRAKVMAKTGARSLADLVKMAVLAGETDPYAFAVDPH